MTLTALKNLPVIGRFVTFFTDQFRLALEYLLIALVIAIGAFSIHIWIEKTKAKQAFSDIRISLEEVKNKAIVQDLLLQAQGEKLSSIERLRSLDAKSLSSLYNELISIAGSDSQLKERINSLENKDESVRTYLDSDVPAGLACVLDETCQD